MADDIIERLRSVCKADDNCKHSACFGYCLPLEAANEIERLRAEVDLKGYRLDDALGEIERLRAAADEIERLRDEINSMASAQAGWGRVARLEAEIARLRAAGDALVAAIRNHDLREEHIKTWKEARRG